MMRPAREVWIPEVRALQGWGSSSIVGLMSRTVSEFSEAQAELLEVGLSQNLRRQCGFFGTPRGRGSATAATWAVFLPHFEHFIRGCSDSSVASHPNRRAKSFGLSQQA
jgi:hypothetical protein